MMNGLCPTSRKVPRMSDMVRYSRKTLQHQVSKRSKARITIQVDKQFVVNHIVGGKYLIEYSKRSKNGFKELGSGQFGKVYAAISDYKVDDSSKGLYSGTPVAIKEISKARFDLRQQAKLKNEALILSKLSHPGVIILEKVYDFDDKVYIVMEQLEDDMLEMILSSPEKKLSERVTKFLAYQILEALKYLHKQNIVHCDLKPENVLLVKKESKFPQVKLCDFGYAKIIEENSFRSSLIGTQAYLAPEVINRQKYNRSVDVWSTGVIVYVSLSGEFPFNDDEQIQDQMSRVSFLFPPNPWDKISVDAKLFITNLLRLKSDRRLSASKALLLDWIQDYQLWCDLCNLEAEINCRWLTDSADFIRWSKYANDHNLQIPQSALQMQNKTNESFDM